MNKAILYCDPRSQNDATNYYCGIIRKCIENFGHTFSVCHKLSDIQDSNIIITITEQYFLKAKCRYPKRKHIYWAQGVNAEETKMNIDSPTQLLRFIFRRFAESYAVNNTDLLFCVSDMMVNYYKENYDLKNLEKIIIMPCYNQQISSEFSEEQYKKPIFAYAGNTSKWQSVDFMIDVFSLVEKQINNAILKIFTKDKDIFEAKLNEKRISNYEISYVPVNELQEELHKCKYGFILRTNHIVNMVATPTKMNSYLAAYMIPIYSDGVIDFAQNIKLNEFQLMAKCPLNAADVATQIIEFENSPHNYSNYLGIVQNIFEKHYNDNTYINLICKKLKQFIIN